MQPFVGTRSTLHLLAETPLHPFLLKQPGLFMNAGRGRYTTHLLKGVEMPVVDVPTRPLEVVADIATEAVMNKKDVVAEMEEAVVVTRDIAKVTYHVEVVVKKDTVVVAVREVAGCYGGSGVDEEEKFS
ncbi:hypothetical protein AtEden1_Chr1g0038291 [Arabidopsis thaliana]